MAQLLLACLHRSRKRRHALLSLEEEEAQAAQDADEAEEKREDAMHRVLVFEAMRMEDEIAKLEAKEGPGRGYSDFPVLPTGNFKKISVMTIELERNNFMPACGFTHEEFLVLVDDMMKDVPGHPSVPRLQHCRNNPGENQLSDADNLAR